MKILNKNGWGLSRELVFLCVFLICFIIAGIGLKKLGLFDNKYNIFSPDFTTDNYNINKSDYYALENTLIQAVKKYVNADLNSNTTVGTKIVGSSFLKDKGYLKNFSIGSSYCSGYVEVTKTEDMYLYSPYINCPDYQTSGYDEGKDW